MRGRLYGKEAWEEEIRQRKEQAMMNMIAAVGTLIVGGVLIVCTFGAATPLVVGTTAWTLSSVVSVSAGLTLGSAVFLYGESNLCESYDSYQYGLKGDARTVAANTIRDTYFAGDPELYYTVGNVCTMAASMMIPVGGSMMTAVNAGTSPVRAGLTELGMLGYSSAMAAESADIVSDLTDSELAGMVAGTIVGTGSYGGLKTLDQSVNISGLYSPEAAQLRSMKEIADSNQELLGSAEPPVESLADLLSPEQAERYLKFLENGSMEGLTDAEIAAIRNVDEALALKKVDGQSVLELRRPAATGENGSRTNKYISQFGEMSEQDAIRYDGYWKYQEALERGEFKNGSIYDGWYRPDGSIDNVEHAVVAPWVGDRGLGIQYKLPRPIQWYMEQGILIPE